MRSKGAAEASSFSHAEYAKCLNERISQECLSRNIRSYKHLLYTAESSKNVLNCFDDKRYVLDDGTKILAHGHYLT